MEVARNKPRSVPPLAPQWFSPEPEEDRDATIIGPGQTIAEILSPRKPKKKKNTNCQRDTMVAQGTGGHFPRFGELSTLCHVILRFMACMI